jgi:hypothetical protein
MMNRACILLFLTLLLGLNLQAQTTDPNLFNSAGGSTSFAPLAGDPASGACCSGLQTSSEATLLNSVNTCRTPNCGVTRTPAPAQNNNQDANRTQ